ncbi:hypothetical protein [Streptomyces sp. NPDC005349]|uniref:hypothetical protein n=1 Tax=unclassified Streptomyces TaxID=2593676 RepID=UPI0033AF5B66
MLIVPGAVHGIQGLVDLYVPDSSGIWIPPGVRREAKGGAYGAVSYRMPAELWRDAQLKTF